MGFPGLLCFGPYTYKTKVEKSLNLGWCLWSKENLGQKYGDLAKPTFYYDLSRIINLKTLIKD